MVLPSKTFPPGYLKKKQQKPIIVRVYDVYVFECMCAIVLTTHLYMGPKDQIQVAMARALPAELCHQPLLSYY